MPFAFHPTFAVPEAGIEILACLHQSIYSYPVPLELGASLSIPNSTTTSLREIPTPQGLMDATFLPLTVNTEELLQVAGCEPPFVLRYPEQHADVYLDWNAEELPYALLWISNGGCTQEPWAGRHFALGVESLNSFLDLDRIAIPSASHPLANRNRLTFKAEIPRTVRYRLWARVA